MERRSIQHLTNTFQRIPFKLDLKSTQLPEYSAMVVLGDQITVEQASAIIIRTDSLNIWESKQGLRNDGIVYLPLIFLRNEWITSEYSKGPHGWCDWEGNIGCHYGNIGPNATVEWIEYEWKLIAYYFPFLKLKCQLFDKDVNDVGRKPIVEYEVNNGVVKTLLPVKSLPHRIWGAKYRTVKEMCESYPVSDRYKGYRDLIQVEEAYKICLRKRK
jgi:hypothetical protein